MNITERAWKKISEIQHEQATADPVRVFVQGGGCSGFQYGFTFSLAEDEDLVLTSDTGAKVVIDPHSLSMLEGATLDYKSDLYSANFVFSNPNVTNTCGCGNSFSV